MRFYKTLFEGKLGNFETTAEASLLLNELDPGGSISPVSSVGKFNFSVVVSESSLNSNQYFGGRRIPSGIRSKPSGIGYNSRSFFLRSMYQERKVPSTL